MKRSLFILTWALLWMPASALADSVQGRVVSVSPSAVAVTVYDAQGKPYPNALQLKVDNKTRVSGVPSVAAFRKQDPVLAQVSQDKTGAWRADSLSLLQTAPQTKSMGASMMDAIRSPAGQKVIRNGVSGAVVGGVASAASGGKAGKGALIGAGAGILGGWLGDVLSQPSGPQQQQTYVAVDPQSQG